MTAKLTNLIFQILKLTKTFQFINNVSMRMIDHGLSKKKISLECMDFKLSWTQNTNPSKTIIRKIRIVIFRVLTLTTFSEIFYM